MPLYENVFIARQDVSAAQADALADKYTEILEQGGGKVAKRENWGLKTLAFRIRKNRKGHYVMLNIDAPAAAVQEMERNMKLDEDVIRYMTIRIEKIEEEPSAMLRSRGRDRDGSDRRRDGGDRRRDRDDDRRRSRDNENTGGDS